MIEPLYDSPYYGLKITNKTKVTDGTLSTFVHYRKCYLCGKQFPVYCDDSQYCYRIGIAKLKAHKQLMFCSWTCLRTYQKDHTSRRQKQGAPRMAWRENKDTALKRVQHCKEKITAYQEAEAEAETAYERQIARLSLKRWKECLKEVEEFLEQMEGIKNDS